MKFQFVNIVFLLIDANNFAVAQIPDNLAEELTNVGISVAGHGEDQSRMEPAHRCDNPGMDAGAVLLTKDYTSIFVFEKPRNFKSELEMTPFDPEVRNPFKTFLCEPNTGVSRQNDKATLMTADAQNISSIGPLGMCL